VGGSREVAALMGGGVMTNSLSHSLSLSLSLARAVGMATSRGDNVA
jgi:hypothetical protein